MACLALREHRRRQLEWRLQLGSQWQDHDLVFCTPFGMPKYPSRINRELDKALATAGLPRIRVHDLRHTFATLALELGVHPKVVQEMLGHSTYALTMDTYSHVAPAMHRDAADKLDALFRAG